VNLYYTKKIPNQIHETLNNFTFQFGSFPTLEILKGDTFFATGGVIRSTNNSGSGRVDLLFIELGLAFNPADTGLLYVS
jgi:hypothetical protein